MKVIDESEWQALKADLIKDPDPRSKAMLDFIVIWAEMAEVGMASSDDKHAAVLRTIPPMEALRSTLGLAERHCGVSVPIMELGQALMILCSVWEPAAADRDRFVASMTPMEGRLFDQVAQLWATARQQQAQQEAMR